MGFEDKIKELAEQRKIKDEAARLEQQGVRDKHEKIKMAWSTHLQGTLCPRLEQMARSLRDHGLEVETSYGRYAENNGLASMKLVATTRTRPPRVASLELAHVSGVESGRFVLKALSLDQGVRSGDLPISEMTEEWLESQVMVIAEDTI